MNKKIAIPLENGVVCAHFGHCQTFAIIEVENNEITGMSEHVPPEHVPGLYPRWVAQFGVTDVIAGGMGERAINLFNEQKINAFVGAPIKPPLEIVKDFIADKLNLSANYCNHESEGHGSKGCNK
ncbi:MAG: ATPase [Bacteroidales bacterium]|nr:ATPase [Bacteroidales bacterium]